MNNALRIDFTTNEDCVFGQLIGRAMYDHRELFELANAAYMPHTGGEHKFMVRMLPADLLAYLDLIDDTIGKTAEVQFARTILEHVVRNSTPIYLADRLRIASLRRTLRDFVHADTTGVYTDDSSAGIQTLLEAILAIPDVDPLSIGMLSYLNELLSPTVQLVE